MAGRMNPMLDIIVTHYTEPWEVGEKLFSILALQRGIDFSSFRALVVNDGEENRLPNECFANLPYQVEQISIPHKGVSAARNAGIDHATAPWLMFCDFDDTFAHIYAIRDILSVLPADGYDMLHSRMIVEDMTEGKDSLTFSPDLQRFVFTHGKVYRKAFLDSQGIRFDETMNFQEDSLFNATIIARTSHKHIGEIKSTSPLYVWIRRSSSVTNSGRDDEAMFSHFIRNIKATEENRINRDYSCYCGMVTRTVWDTYYMLECKPGSQETKRKIRQMFIPWIRERYDMFGNVEDEILAKIIAVARTELRADPIPDDKNTVAEWLENILKGGDNIGNYNAKSCFN